MAPTYYRRATEVRISTALMALIQAGTFEIPFDLSRGPLPEFKKELLTTTKVVIVPQKKEADSVDRVRDRIDFDIGVAVLKSVGLTSNYSRDQETEDLQALAEQLQELVLKRQNQILTLPAVLDGSAVEIQPEHNARLNLPFVQEPILDAKTLRDPGIFVSLSFFNYHFEAVRA